MPQVINTNVLSLNAQRNLNRTQGDIATAMQRLSSGLRINSAKDDAAGLAISNRMTTQVRGMNQAVRNAADAISLAQVGEGALQQVTDNLQRMRELAIQSRNATNSVSDRQSLNQEFQQLMQANDQIARTTAFNGRNVLDGSLGSAVFQVGANVGETISLDVSSSMRTNAIGKYASASFSLATDTTATDGDTYLMDEDGDLTVNGVSIGAATAGGNGAGAGSAKSVAEAINLTTDQHGVTATAGSTTTTVSATDITSFAFTDAGTDDTLTYTLNVNGTDVFTQGEADTPRSASDLASDINAFSGTTGVVATVNDDNSVTLTAVDGRNIELQETLAGSTNADADTVVGYFGNTLDATGATSATNFAITKADVTLEAETSIALSFDAADDIERLFGFADGTTTDTTAAQTLNTSDVLNENNVDLAIKRIDQAMSDVDTLRATFGALQSRFESTIESLEVNAENVSAARSRIQDADFAMETANLTKAQILQQAGTAMLAQANVQSQGVLALLQ